jgi:hypothetical protein
LGLLSPQEYNKKPRVCSVTTPTGSRHQKSSKGSISPGGAPALSAEGELDSLLTRVEQDKQKKAAAALTDSPKPDPITLLREQTLRDLIPAFVELSEKYGRKGIAMQMDAAGFLQGGRDIKFEFCVGAFRSQLHGTVTTEAIAFHEVKHSPSVQGELVSGPWLRLRHLTTDAFRQFLCERLGLLVRAAAKGS